MHQPFRFPPDITWVLGFKILLALVPVMGFFVLINDHFLLTPTRTYTYRPGHPARVISPDDPSTLIQTADPKLRWKMTTDQLPFQVTVPRAIVGIRVHGQLQSGTQPTVYLTATGVKGAVPRVLIASAFLDTLDWNKVTDGTSTVWMRGQRLTTEKKTVGTGKDKHEVESTWAKDIRQYSSVAQFKSDPPELASIATVGYDRLSLAAFPQAEPDQGTIKLPQVFRGSHQFYAYATGSELKITFDKIDRNRGKKADPMTVRVGRAEDLSDRRQRWLTTIKVKDDGNVGNSGPQGRAQPVAIDLPVPRPGVYLVQIETNEDVLFTNLSSSAHRLSFTGRVFLVDGPAYNVKDFHPLTILTNGSSLTLAPAHEQGKQDLQIAGQKYSLKGVNVEVVASGLKEITSVQINKPDIKIHSDGLITIMPAQIMPSAGTSPLDLTGTPNLDAVDYVLAEYQPHSGTDVTFDETFTWSELGLQGKRLSFAIEAPGLQANSSTLALKKLQATLLRGPFPWGKVWEKTIGKIF